MERKMIAADIITCSGYNDRYVGYAPSAHPKDRFHAQIRSCVNDGWELLGPIQFMTQKNGDVYAVQQIVKYEEIK